MKIRFKEKIQEQIDLLPSMGGVKLTYTLFMGTNREMDLSNVCVVVDKFFCDAIVEAGKLEDDNFKFLGSIDYRWGGIDPGNPRCEVTLEPTSIIKDNTMRISLVQAEIEEALKAYISEQMTIADGMDFKIALAATRGEQGFTAEIDIVRAVVEEAPAKKTRGRRASHTDEENTVVDLQVSSNESPYDNETQTEPDETGPEIPVDPNPEENVPAFLKKKSIFGSASAE